MRFELTIPPSRGREGTVLTVEAPNWLEALRTALEQTGGRQIARGKAICEVKDDGTILVKDTETEDVFYLRTVTGPSDPTSTRRSRRPQTIRHTMTYLDAELMQKANEKNAAARNAPPEAETPVSVNHPCIVMNKEEIDRRLRAHSVQQKVLNQIPVELTPVERPADPPRTRRPERNVQMIHVVEVAAPKKDTLTTLKVDLDALRAATNRSPGKASNVVQPPTGFEWLVPMLDNAWKSTSSVHELGDRALRLCLAALPCRLALFVVRQSSGQLYVEKAIGEMAEHLSGQILSGPSGLTLACIENSLSIVADGRAPDSPYSVSNLERELGVRVRNAILSPMTDGQRSVGALVLADSLSGQPFEPTDLAVADYLGRSVFTWVVEHTE